jgi:hypothetical protein
LDDLKQIDRFELAGKLGAQEIKSPLSIEDAPNALFSVSKRQWADIRSGERPEAWMNAPEINGPGIYYHREHIRALEDQGQAVFPKSAVQFAA